MANSKIYFKSEAGGTTTLSRDTSANSGNLVLPAGGNVVSVDTAVTDNAIARFDSTTGKLQNSSVIIDDNGNVGIEGNLNLSATSVVQPNITNTNMVFKVRPSGSATYAALTGYNSSDISNTHFGQIAVRNDAVTIDSSKTGTGTFKPLKLGIGGSYPIVIDAGNNLSLGTGIQGVGALLPDNGEMTVKPGSTVGGVRISATASDYSSLPSWMSTSLGQYGSAASGNYITGIPKANLGMLWGQNITNMIIGSNSSSPLVFVNSSTERMRIDTSGNLLLTSGYGALGYGTGAGGTVTQLTSKSTTVTLNKPCGVIIMNNAALAAGTVAGFYFNNSLLSVGDLVYPQVDFDNGAYGYNVWCGLAQNGTVFIQVKNITTGSLSDAVRIKFVVIKGANS